MTKQDKIKLGVRLLEAVLVIVLLITLFKGNKKDLTPYNELVAAKDSVIASQEREKEAILSEIAERQISLDALDALDSIINENNKQFSTIYKLLDAKLKNIPARINNISGNNDSIRAAFHNF